MDSALYTTAAWGDPLMINPSGLAIATDIVSPLPTVMPEITSVRVVPLPLSAPLVAPVTVMSLAAKVVGSTSKVRVNAVESAVPEVPPVWTALWKATSRKLFSVSGHPKPITSSARTSATIKTMFFFFRIILFLQR